MRREHWARPVSRSGPHVRAESPATGRVLLIVPGHESDWEAIVFAVRRVLLQAEFKLVPPRHGDLLHDERSAARERALCGLIQAVRAARRTRLSCCEQQFGRRRAIVQTC
jgi:hypothetical protein